MATHERGIDKAVRIAGGIRALCYKADVPERQIYRWLAYGYVPFTAHAIAISRVTGVAIEDLAPPTARAPQPSSPTRGPKKKGGLVPGLNAEVTPPEQEAARAPRPAPTARAA